MKCVSPACILNVCDGCGVCGVCAASHPAMLLVEMLLARLLCVLKDKMLGFLRGNAEESWSSGLVTADHRSRDDDDDVDDTDDAEDEAGFGNKSVHSEFLTVEHTFR